MGPSFVLPQHCSRTSQAPKAKPAAKEVPKSEPIIVDYRAEAKRRATITAAGLTGACLVDSSATRVLGRCLAVRLTKQVSSNRPTVLLIGQLVFRLPESANPHQTLSAKCS